MLRVAFAGTFSEEPVRRHLTITCEIVAGRNPKPSQEPSPSMGEGLGGGDAFVSQGPNLARPLAATSDRVGRRLFHDQPGLLHTISAIWRPIISQLARREASPPPNPPPFKAFKGEGPKKRLVA